MINCYDIELHCHALFDLGMQQHNVQYCMTVQCQYNIMVGMLLDDICPGATALRVHIRHFRCESINTSSFMWTGVVRTNC